MAKTKKDIKETVILDMNSSSDSLKDNVLVDKGISVKNYVNQKTKYSETEEDINYSDEEAYNRVKEYLENKSLSERAEIVLTTFGRKFNTRSIYNSIIELMEILPYACNNFNIMIIGDKGTGKTGMYQAPSNIPLIISEQPTNSDLRGNKVSKGSPFLDYSIINIDEIGDFKCVDVISTIKSFEETGAYLKCGAKEHKSKCSIVKCGNNNYKISEFQELIAKNILNGISSEWTTEAYLSRQTALIYHSDILPLTEKSFVELGTRGLNTALFLKNLDFLKECEREINITVPKEIPVRKYSIILKAVKGLVNILYPDIIPPNYILEAFLDIVIHFNSTLENKHYNPFKMSNLKFWLELIKPKDLKIEEGYLLKNRILLKIDDKFWKIALTPFGAIENEKEILFYNDKENSRIPVAKIYPESNRLLIIQDYYQLYSTSNHFDENGNKIPFDQEKENIIEKYNNLLINLFLMAGKYGEDIPKENFYKRKLYSKERIEEIIKEFFNLNNSIYISSSCFSYDGEYKITLINFANLIKNDYIL